MAEVKFFKTRREMEIGDFHSLKSRGNERRVKVSVRIPLSNRPTNGCPQWVLDGYEFVVKDASLYNKTGCKGVRLEGMSIDLFSTDAIKKKLLSLNACNLDRFSVERVGSDEKAIVYLNLVVYAPTSKEQVGFWYEFQGATAFAEFDATQATFAYGGEDEDDEDEEEVPGDLVGKMADPNDDPTAPVPGDKRSVTKPTDPPGSHKRSHHGPKKK